LLKTNCIEVVALVTTINEAFNRVAMHALRQELLHAQAEAAGLPLIEVPIPYPCSNADYESRMRALIERLQGERIARMAFGDLYLTDIRAYREKQLQGTGIAPLFPLWNEPTQTCTPHDRWRTARRAHVCRSKTFGRGVLRPRVQCRPARCTAR
jgi:diphthamide synthase (EF-2-diphthine--ammonia ligase)